MPAVTLVRRILADRRASAAVSLAALVLTLLAAWVANDPQTIGPTMLLPWVALVTFSVYLAIASSEGLNVTPIFVIGRLASFLLISLGVGLAGKTLRDRERRSRSLVEGLPLAMYTEDAGGLTYVGPQIESMVGYPAASWLVDHDLW